MGGLGAAAGVGMAMRKRKGSAQGGRPAKRRKGGPVRMKKYLRARPFAAFKRPVKARGKRKVARRVGGSKVAAELTWKKLRLGSRRKTRVSNKQMTKLATVTAIDRFNNIGIVDRTGERGAQRLGAFWVPDNTITSNVVTTGGFVDNASVLTTQALAVYLRTPIDMFLLNSATNNADAEVAYFLVKPFINLADGKVTFTRQSGMNWDGTTAVTLPSVEESSNQTLSDSVKRFVKFNWYDIRLGLRNAKAQTTFYDIMIVTFKDSHLDPLENPGDIQQLADRRAFYQELASGGIVHPVASNDRAWTKVMKRVYVHKKVRVVMDKQLTNDSDTSPDIKVVKIFYRDGNMYDYAWHAAEGGLESRVTQLANPNCWKPQTMSWSLPSAQPHPRARKWLIVRAFDPTVGATVASDFALNEGTWDTLSTDVVPTYDFRIRRSYTTNGLT